MVERHANLSFSESRMEIHEPFTLTNVNPDSMIIFVHPPKVAGTNLRFFMTALASHNPSIRIRRFALPRVAGNASNVITEGWRGGLASAESEPDETFKNLNFISGHFPVGIHKRLKGHFNYIPMIRDPVEREISVLNFSYQRGRIEKESAMRYLMEEAIDNPQTRMIAGENFMSGPCAEETYNAAHANIQQHFLFAAPHTAAFEVMQVLAGFYRSGPFAIAKAQVTGIKLIDGLSEELTAKLRAKHAFDMRLVEDVKMLWSQWKQEHVTAGTGNPDNIILCIDPEFGSTKKPSFMSREDVHKQNAQRGEELVMLSQAHTGIKLSFDLK